MTGLTGGVSYPVSVTATNTYGTGSSASVSVTPTTGPPDAPTGLTGTASNDGTISVSWTPPASNNGAVVTSYTLAYTTGTTTLTVSAITGTSTTISGLTGGSLYTLSVAAVNSAGAGTASASITKTPKTPPLAPTSLSATAGNNNITLTWTAASNGGSPITSYVITYGLAGGSTSTASASGTSVTLSNLVGGSLYTMSVQAVTAIGTSSSSSSVTQTPLTVTGVPTSLTAVSGNAQVTLTWVAPSTSSTFTITGYTVAYKTTGSALASTTVLVGNVLTTTVTGLINRASYDFQVRALYPNGVTGSYTTAVSSTPVLYTIADLLSALSTAQASIVGSVPGCHTALQSTASSSNALAGITTANATSLVSALTTSVSSAISQYKALGNLLVVRKKTVTDMKSLLGLS